MATKTGITSSTYERMVFGPGTVSIDDVVIGATKGGNQLEIIRTFRDIRPDGAKGKVKNFRYLESVEAILTVRMLEVIEEYIVYALAGSSLSSHVITGGDIDADTYITAVQLDAEMKGVTAANENAEVEVELSNVLVEGPFVLNLPETGEAVIELKFHAHYSDADLATEPWAITFTPAS
uniref:Tail protein n=1 Tax=viral metagenome TaxID=1070528 RepID=A0A6M3INU7_9ZZZZ